MASFSVDGTSPDYRERLTILVRVGNRLSLTALNTFARIGSRGYDLTGAVDSILQHQMSQPVQTQLEVFHQAGLGQVDAAPVNQHLERESCVF